MCAFLCLFVVRITKIVITNKSIYDILLCTRDQIRVQDKLILCLAHI